MNYAITLLLASSLLLPALSKAQTQYIGWLASYNTIKTGKHTGIHSDFQLRSSDEVAHVQSILLRAGFNYNAGKKFVITAGYAFIDTRRVSAGVSGLIPEHRIWEQLIFNQKAGRVSIGHRFRVEQRFVGTYAVENDELVQTGHFFAGRLRYFIRNLIPLKKQQPFTNGVFAAVQNEVFVNIGNKANLNGKGFDQNRAYLAVGYRLNPSLDLEAGYVNQYISGTTGRTNNHIAQLAVYLRR